MTRIVFNASMVALMGSITGIAYVVHTYAPADRSFEGGFFALLFVTAAAGVAFSVMKRTMEGVHWRKLLNSFFIGLVLGIIATVGAATLAPSGLWHLIALGYLVALLGILSVWVATVQSSAA